jgi:crotonobetainyl-CoA:carnitine CoA-transferase CaiB-like acyl-CoA transferase
VLGGARPHRRGNRHPSIAPYETYATADRRIAIAVGNDRLFARLCEALGRPELPGDPRFATNSARVEHVEALAAELEPVLRTRPAAEWIDALRAASVPVGPINDVAEAFALAESLGLDPVDAATGVPAPPLRLSGERPEVRLAPPKLDEHGDEIRSWLRRAPGGSSSGA